MSSRRADVTGSKAGKREGSDEGGVHLYCMTALVAEEASRNGFHDFARGLETALSTLLATLTRDEQAAALRFAYEAVLGGEGLAPPRLRLIYSRD